MLGISKETFLSKHVVPATPDDRFNDNKCSFCWGEYNDSDHPAVRVLTCDHVFGGPCLLTITKGANGDRCPICKTPFFSPWVKDTFDDFLVDLLVKIVLATVWYMKFWNWLPTPVRGLIRFSWCRHSILYYAELVMRSCTNMHARNPDLNLWVPMHITSQIIYFSFPVSLALASLLAVIVFLSGAHGEFSNLKDRKLFVGIMVVAVLLWSIMYVGCNILFEYLFGLL